MRESDTRIDTTAPASASQPAQSDTRLFVGQVWEHHSTGRYELYHFYANGDVGIRSWDREQPHHHRVRADYLLANFTLWREHA